MDQKYKKEKPALKKPIYWFIAAAIVLYIKRDDWISWFQLATFFLVQKTDVSEQGLRVISNQTTRLHSPVLPLEYHGLYMVV